MEKIKKIENEALEEIRSGDLARVVELANQAHGIASKYVSNTPSEADLARWEKKAKARATRKPGR